MFIVGKTSADIPHGYITLVEARELYEQRLWDGEESYNELRRALTRNLLGKYAARIAEMETCARQPLFKAFADGELEALTGLSGDGGMYRVPRTAWATDTFAERLFDGPRVVIGLGEFWNGIVGRVPFVEKEQVVRWLATANFSATIDAINTMRRDIAEELKSDGINLDKTALKEIKPQGSNAGGHKTLELRKQENDCARWLVDTHFSADPDNTGRKGKAWFCHEAINAGKITGPAGKKGTNASFLRAWNIGTKEFPAYRQGSEAWGK